MKNLKIRTKLLVSFGIVLILTIIVSVFSILQLRKANNNLDEFMEGAVAADDAVKNCRIATFIAAKDVRDMIIVGQTDAAKLQAIEENEATIKANLEEIHKLNILDKDEVTKLENTLTQWMGVADDIVARLKAGDAMGAAELTRTQCSPALDEVISEINVLIENSASIRTKTLSDSVKSTNMSMIVLLCITVGAILLAMIICARVTRIIVYPVHQVENAMEGLAKGKMSQELEYESLDEFGALVSSVRDTCQGLEDVVQDLTRLLDQMAAGNFDLFTEDNIYKGDFEPLLRSIRKMNRSLSDTMRQINDASDQVASGADQVSSGAQALSQGATEQASSVEELAATINDISREVSNTADNAREASEKVMEAQSKLSVSNEQMQAFVDAFITMFSNVELTAVMKEADEKAGTAVVTCTVNTFDPEALTQGMAEAMNNVDPSAIESGDMEAAFGSILQAMADVIADIKPTDKTADFDVDFVLRKMDVNGKEKLIWMPEDEAKFGELISSTAMGG